MKPCENTPWDFWIHWGREHHGFMWLCPSKLSEYVAFCSYGNNKNLNTEGGEKFKGTATGNWTHYHRGTYWHCRYTLEVGRSTDIGGWTVGKGQSPLHLIHPPEAPDYYCNSLWRDLPSRLTHICQAKQSLKPTNFPTTSFLLHSVSWYSQTVRWDHHHGRSDVGCFWLKHWRSAAFDLYQNNESNNP